MSFETLVIDNGSFDGSRALVEGNYPSVQFLQSERNLGFAGANNEAAKRARGDLILFLNPDTEVKRQAIRLLVSSMNSLPDAGIVAPKLLNSDGSVQTTCLQAFPTILNHTLAVEPLRRLTPKSSLWGHRALYVNADRPIAVDVVSGACLMIRRELFTNLSCFDSNYFMYGEDIDLCFKAKQAGWRTYYIPGAEVIHHGGQSSAAQSHSNFSSVMMRQSMVYFMRKHHGSTYAAAYRGITSLAAAVRLMMLIVAMALPIRSERRNMLRKSMRKWTAIFRWTIGLEAWVSRYPLREAA